jgi:nucleoid-associated protein YgaU
MAASSMSRMVALGVAVVAIGGVALVFALQRGWREQPAGTKTVAATTEPAMPATATPEQSVAAARAQATALVSALAGSPPPAGDADGLPAFDIARIEPSGEAVIAGRATPGATVELLRNGEVHDRVVADPSGQFAMVPPRFPAGTYDLTLRASQKDGKQATSKQSVTVTFEKAATERPVVALMTPGKPTVVMSQPAAAKQAPGAVVVEAVEVEPQGKFHLSGRARPGAAVRFYLNDSFVAAVTAAADGRFSITVNEGISPGNYRVRLDEVEPKSGAVQARAEVPFNVPDTLVTASIPARAQASKSAEAVAQKPAETATPQPQLAAATTTTAPNQSSPSTAVVAKIVTTTVTRGDSLWRISQNSYGAGVRYAVIYKANQEQIRNPHMIYPGQVFVLPAQ